MTHAVQNIFWLLLVLNLCIAASASGQTSPPPNPPNIVLIFPDDLGYGDIGAYGAQDIFTPNIDRIASEGVMLTDFYVAPSCGLSRAMLLTGSYAPRVSLARNHTPSANTGLHSDEISLGEILQDAGYVTGIFGKWHLGDHYQFRPLRHGFDEFFGIPYSDNMWPFHPRTRQTAGEDPRLTAARARAELTGYADQGNPFRRGEGYPNLPLYDGDTIVEFNSDQTGFGAAFIDRALDFIERNSANRFFAYIPLTAPHVPLHPSETFVGTSSRDLYGDTVQEIDFGVGRVLDKLVELGIDNETLVIFISDNGPWLEYGIDGGSAGALSGGKGTQFEGGIRVPAVMRWPGQLTAGSVIGEPLSAIDMLPTLANLAGVAVPSDRTIDGMDVWPLLTNQVSTVVREAFFSFVESNFSSINLGAIRSGDWKLHVVTSGGSANPLALYDLASDVGETTDMSAGEPGIVSTLLALGDAVIGDIAASQRPLGQVVLSGEPFAQKAGAGDLISIEAEHFHERQAKGGQNWDVVSFRHNSAEGSVQALPNNGTNRNSNYANSSPHLGFDVVVEVPGRYYVWLRARGETVGDDSLHIGLDGQPLATGERVDQISDYWGWTSTRSSVGERSYIDVQSAGEHTIDVWMREDGVVLDKLVLTSDAGFQPYGKGPVESRQSFDGLAIPPVAADDGPYTIDEGASVATNPNVLDNDTEPRNDPKTAVLVTGPAQAAVFELRPDGTFDYMHDGSETVADSFTYTANDIDGASNEAVVTFSITPVNDPPLITLSGSATVNINVGDVYNDAGATALDAEDGDLTTAIIVNSNVDSSVAGTYMVSYDVSDTDGEPASQVTRAVIIAAPPPPPPPQQKSGGGLWSLWELLGLTLIGAWIRLHRYMSRSRRPSLAR